MSDFPTDTLVQDYLRRALNREQRAGVVGILDPEYKRTGFVNPRYQEACLTLALAAEHSLAIPEGHSREELVRTAIHAMDQWLRQQHRSGAIRTQPNGVLDTQATAYGLFAVARTALLLKDRIPSNTANRAQKGLRKAARYLSSAPIPPGPETRPLRAAALHAAAEYLESPAIHATSRALRREGERLLRESLANPEKHPQDAGALALTFAYLVLGEAERSSETDELYGRIARRSLLSTTPGGLFGGGAESSLASLPILTGYCATADRIDVSARVASLLKHAFSEQLYNALLDPDVPWLTPMSYLHLYAHLYDPGETIIRAESDSSFPILNNGCGRIQLDEWSLRLGMGGTLGWMHHHPTDSTRLFGSPTGLALREGPWLIEGNRLRHPSYAGKFKVIPGTPWTIEGELYSLPIPGTERSPRRKGFPRLHGRKSGTGTRLAPPPKLAAARASAPVKYRREIEMKDGALTVETMVEGKVLHRLPMIWPGGMYGEIIVDKNRRLLTHVLEERRVREISFEGGYWPNWTVRFDRPVDLLYEPIHGLITTSPMRYLSAAGGTFDILATDRLHMAWRVG
ncbi:hypothetical protein KQI63_14095 [bacterium]|nr:hypothetical protein [bacterium]